MADEQRLKAAFFLGDNEAALTVHAVRGREEVSCPHRFEVDFSGREVDVDGAPGQRASLLLESPRGGERNIAGVVEELAIAATVPAGEGARSRYRAIIVPEPYLALSLRHGFRIFQEKSTAEIVQQVCKDAGLKPELFDWG